MENFRINRFSGFSDTPEPLTPAHLQIRRQNEKRLKEIARFAGFKIRFTRVEALEVMCDIYHGKRDKTMLYKGWDDEMFSIGDSVTIDRRGRGFKYRFHKIHEIVAMNYISMLFPPGPKWPRMDIFLLTGMDTEGFNGTVLKKTVKRFTRAIDKVKKFVK